MRMRSGTGATTIALALMLVGCDKGDGVVARAAGTNGATIEMPVPDPSPSSGGKPGLAAASPPADTMPGAIAAHPGATLATIGFPDGGAVLNGAAKAMLDRLASDATVKKAGLVLRGNSDSEGDDAANRITSRKRAEAVRDYLARKGLSRDRMKVIALGETRPIAPNAKPDGSDDKAGRARNRRVEIELLPAA